MNRKHVRFTFRKLLVFTSIGLLASYMFITPEADAGRRGGKSGSVRHSSGGGGRSAGGSRSSRGGSRSTAGNRGGNRGGAASSNRGGNRGGTAGGNRGGNRAGSGNRAGAGSGNRGSGNRGSGNTINRGGNTNININRGGGGGYRAGYNHGRADNRYNHRKDARRDWMRFRTINNAMRLGAYALTRPTYSTTVVVAGTSYYYFGGVYYVSSGTQYVVTAPPPGAVVYAVPAPTTVIYAGSTSYYYFNGTFYQPTDKPAERPEGAAPPPTEDGAFSVQGEGDGPEMIESEHNYKVVAPPVGASVPYLPEEADEVEINGKKYSVYDGTYYQAFVNDGDTIYMVVEDPSKAST